MIIRLIFVVVYIVVHLFMIRADATLIMPNMYILTTYG